MDDDRTLSEKILKRLDNAYDIALPLRRMAKLGVATKALGILNREKDPVYAQAMRAADERAEAYANDMKRVNTNALRRAVGLKTEPEPQYDWSKWLRDVEPVDGFKKGGKTSKKAKVSSSSKRGDGIAQRGKTRGRIV